MVQHLFLSHEERLSRDRTRVPSIGSLNRNYLIFVWLWWANWTTLIIELVKLSWDQRGFDPWGFQQKRYENIVERFHPRMRTQLIWEHFNLRSFSLFIRLVCSTPGFSLENRWDFSGTEPRIKVWETYLYAPQLYKLSLRVHPKAASWDIELPYLWFSPW